MQMLDDDPSIPVVQLESTPKPRDKSLRTNHPCAICGVYRHYTNHYPNLPNYRVALYENPDLETAPPTSEEILPPVSPPFEEINTIYMISSAPTPLSTDLTTETFRTDEEILEALTALEYPWDDMHHRSYFLPNESSSNTATKFAVESKDFLPPRSTASRTLFLLLTPSKRVTWPTSHLSSKLISLPQEAPPNSSRD